MTYGEWYAQYVSLYKRRIAAKTRESYARLHALLSDLHPVELSELRPDDIQRALIRIEEAAGSRQSRWRIRSFPARWRAP